MSSPEKSAVAAYSGYEYQIIVSVWVALDLVIARACCDAIEIEPASQEDIAANLCVSREEAETIVDAATGDGPVEIQIKRRSRFWSTSDFFDMVETPPKRGARGPAPRERALARLNADPRLRYVVITDAEVHPDLKGFVVELIGRKSSATDASVFSLPTSIATRIGVLEKRVQKLIESESEDILEQSARVPLQRVHACRESLVQRVRERLLGRCISRLDRAEIEALIVQHGGFPPSMGDEFVPPASFDELERRIDEAPFALVLVGPPGVGKSFAADKIVEKHCRSERPFKIEKNPTPHEIRRALATPGRTLFYLEDPWGRYRLADDADTWTDELPRLIREAKANPDKRFLITSRTGLLMESIDLSQRGRDLDRFQRAIGAYVRPIREIDFDVPLRREILRRWMRGATRWQRDWVEDRLTDIVSRLTVPQAIAAFAHSVKAGRRETDLKLGQLLSESQVAAIGDVVKQQVRSMREVASGVMLWAFLAVGEPLTESEAQELAIWLAEDWNLSLDIPRLYEHMRANGWLSSKDAVLVAHSTVIEGLERLVDEERATSNRVLRALFATLVRRDKSDLAARLLLRLHGRNLPISEDVRLAIEEHLRDSLLSADDTHFASAIENLAGISTATDPVSLLARALGARKHSRGIERWSPPPWWTEQALTTVSGSREAECVARRYIQHALGQWSTWPGLEKLIDFLCSFGWDLSDDFLSAALAAFEWSNKPINVALHGALAAPAPAYGQLLDAALKQLDEVNRWFDEKGADEQRRAEEGELDAMHSAHVLDEPSERFYLSTSSLEQIVAVRRSREGFGWLAAHPRRADLVPAWAQAIPYDIGDGAADELRTLLDAASDSNRSDVWEAIGRSRCRSLTGMLHEKLARGPVSELAAVWGSLFGFYDPGELPAIVSPVLGEVAWDRRAAIAFAACKANIPDRNDHFHREPNDHRSCVSELLAPMERQAVDSCMAATSSQHGLRASIDPEALDLIGPLMVSPDEMLAVGACLVLACRGRAASINAQRLSSSENQWVRLYSLRAIDAKEPSGREILTHALSDPYYKCRRDAMYILSEEASSDERAMIIKMASDSSAPVREACVRIIGNRRWSDGLETLCGLLKDQRDRNEGGFTADATPDYHVARAAGRALYQFPPPLPQAVLNAVMQFLRGGARSSDDLVIHYELLDVVAVHSDPALAPLVKRLLRSTRRMGGEKGSFPLRYAAGWCWVGHILRYPDDAALFAPEVLVEAAEHTDDRLAAPALLALGISWKHARNSVQQVLASNDISDGRALLVEVGARLAGQVMPEDLVERRLPSTHPGRRLIKWCWDSDEPDPSWSERLAADVGVQEWLAVARESTPIHAALRFAMLQSPRSACLTMVSRDDFRDGELTEENSIISTFYFAGLE